MPRPFRLFLLIILLAAAVMGCGTKEAAPKSASPTRAHLELEATAPAPSLGDTRTRSLDGAVMVYVPAGEFKMGSDDKEVDWALQQCWAYGTNCSRRYFSVEQPEHVVGLDGFWIDKTEVTYRQYRQCQEAGACGKLGCQGESEAGSSEQPAVCVTWSQAAAYCKWVAGRLPTEAEWEYAARGTESRRYPWGDEFDGTRLNYCDANCALDKRDKPFDDGYARSAPVGSYPKGASWVGALDMAGNVWELVADWNGEYSPERQSNPTGPLSGDRRVVRGGSWNASPDHVRGALRNHVGADEFVNQVGFRCAVSRDK
jgi:formylglycine-generating enzyme required for sulfatase activity